MGRVLAGLCSLMVLGGCAPTSTGGVTVSLVPGMRSSAIAHRWLPRDVHHYELVLNGEVSLALPPGSREGRFLHLKQGKRYRIEARAWGNPGGTQPERVLNRQTPAIAEVDLTPGQDVPEQVSLSLAITLDPVPFEGTALLVPENLPNWAKTLDLTLADGGGVRFSQSFPAGPIRLTNLRAGTPYRISAIANGKNRTRAAEGTLYFDPAQVDLEQAATVSLGF